MKASHSRRAFRFVLVILTLVFGLCGDLDAQITPWHPMSEAPWRSRIDRGTLDMMVEVVSLSEAQELYIDRLFEEHQKSFKEFVAEGRKIADEYKQAIRSAKTDLDRLDLKLEREEVLAPYADRQARLDDAFLEQVKGSLAESQWPAWQLAIYRLNRESWLRGGGWFAEEKVDLIDLLEQLIDSESYRWESVSLRELASRYATELDPALRKRMELLVAVSRRLERDRGWATDGEKVWVDPTLSARLMQPGVMGKWRIRLRSHQHLREINTRYFQEFQMALPESLREEFILLFQQEILSHLPSMYDDTTGMITQFIDQTLHLESLTDEQREAIRIESITYQQRYMRQAKTIFRTYNKEAETRRNPQKEFDDRQKSKMRYQKAVSDLQQLEIKFVTRIWNLLDEIQQSKIKKPDLTTA